MKIALRYSQMMFFLGCGLIGGALLSNYIECREVTATNAVYLTLPPIALTNIKI